MEMVVGLAPRGRPAIAAYRRSEATLALAGGRDRPIVTVMVHGCCQAGPWRLFQASKFVRVVEELGRRVDLLGELLIQIFDKLLGEVTLPALRPCRGP
jgi:hypothetical protein